MFQFTETLFGLQNNFQTKKLLQDLNRHYPKSHQEKLKLMFDLMNKFICLFLNHF